jgi:RNA polymerase sigma-70 factor (ECF subfamily)
LTQLALIHSPRGSRDDDGDGDDAAEVVRRAQAGDAVALRDLYRRHAEWVRRLLARVLGVSGEVDDVLQETFLRTFRDLGALREPAAFPGFLRAIAVSAARRSLRTRARKRWLQLFAPDDVPECWSGPADDPAWETVRATYRILRAFPVDERLAFTLRHLHGMQLAEVALAMGVSLATCKRRLDTANERFAREATVDGPLAAMFPARPPDAGSP